VNPAHAEQESHSPISRAGVETSVAADSQRRAAPASDADPTTLSPRTILALQRTVGNASVRRLLARRSTSTSTSAAARPVPVTPDVRVAEDALEPPSATTAGSKYASESQSATLPPVQTEDEKISYVAATTPTLNDAVPSGSSGLTRISLSDVAINAEVYDDSGSWKIRVLSAATTIHWGIDTSGYTVPDPRDGGNITAANWRTVIADLRGYAGRQAAGSWHSPEASRVHEMNHVDWYRGEINRTWPTIETAITTHVLGSSGGSPPMTQAAAQAAMASLITQKRRDWFNAYGLAPEPPAYAAGQVVLNRIIADIEAYAHTKGWDAPPPPPSPSP
jgi:hypothetical protein